MKTKIVLSFAAFLALTPFAAAQADDGGGWDWGLTPYLWASSIHSDLREDLPPVGNETEFSSIISKIDMAFLGHVEGQGDDFGVFGDVVYLSLADGQERKFLNTETDLDTLIVELAGVWAPNEVRGQGFEVFAGVRHIVADLNLAVDPNADLIDTWNTGIDQSFTDFMLGGRYRGAINKKWGYSLRGDGAWGDTEGTYSASAMLMFKTGSGEWNFGYRFLDTELKAGSTTLSLQLQGPIVGYTFKF